MEIRSTASACGPGAHPSHRAQDGGPLNVACTPPAHLPQSFSGSAWQCNGNRRRAGGNNWDISGQPGAHCGLFLPGLPTGFTALCVSASPAASIPPTMCRPGLLWSVRMTWKCPAGSWALSPPWGARCPILETQLLRSQTLERSERNLVDVF